MELSDFDRWLEMGLGERAWTDLLDLARPRLHASALALGLAPRWGANGEVFASAGAERSFLEFCRSHLSDYGAQEVQWAESNGCTIGWAHVSSDRRALVQDVAVFAALPFRHADAPLAHIAHGFARIVAARRERLSLRTSLALCRATFDRLPFGVVMVDADLHATQPNSICREIFARGDGLLQIQNRLECRFEADRLRLLATITESFVKPTNVVREPMSIGRARGAKPYGVLPLSSVTDELQKRLCLLAVTDPDRARPDLVRRSMTAFGLEARQRVGG